MNTAAEYSIFNKIYIGLRLEQIEFQEGCFYRPQRSCGKVMFSQVSVILSAGGAYLGSHPLGRHPTCTDTPWADPPGRQPPWADTQPPPGADSPGHTPTVADGTHPTGMHSC